MLKNIKEKILKTEDLFTGKIFKVEKKFIELKSGKKTYREIIKHPGSVAIIPFIDNESIILIEQYRSALEKTILEIPAGTLEQNEDPEDCARRELLEETGYTTKNFKKLFTGYTSPGYSDEKMHFFLATDLTFKGERPEEDEDIKTRIVKLYEIRSMIKNGIISDLKTICGIYTIIDLNDIKQTDLSI